MKRAFTAVAIAVCSVALVAQERDRGRIPEQYKWNLADIYPSDAAWRTAKDKLAADLPQIKQFEGRLTASAQTLADALDRQSALDKELSRLYAYAGMRADEDTRDSQHEGMRQEMTQIAAGFAAQTAYVEPELLRAGRLARSGPVGHDHPGAARQRAGAGFGRRPRPGRAVPATAPRSGGHGPRGRSERRNLRV